MLQASLARPVLIGPTYAGVAELQVGQSLTHSPLSSHRELKRDLVARWRYKRHELAYEWASWSARCGVVPRERIVELSRWGIAKPEYP